MKQLDFTSLNEIANSNIAQDLSEQTVQSIRNVQVPTVEGFTPTPVILPIVESVMQRENEMRGSLRQSQPPALAHYYLAINNEPKGPFTQSQVVEFLVNGLITQETLCWQPNMTEWVAISYMKEFNI
jgi:hypothetical protein